MADTPSPMLQRITDKTLVPMGIAASVLIGSLLFATNWATRFVRVESSLQQVVDELRAMNRRMEHSERNSVSKSEFAAYLAVLEARNPTLVVPPPPPN